MYIYCITNLINGKQYVGLSTKLVEESVNYYGSGNVIKSSVKKYGKENFKKEILEKTDSINNLKELEIYWISKMNTKHPNGYNLTDGGDGILNPTKETINKMRFKKVGTHLSKESIDKIKKNNPNSKTVEQIDRNTNKIISKYTSIGEASIITNVGRTQISSCINGKQKSAGGYIWKSDDVIIEKNIKQIVGEIKIFPVYQIDINNGEIINKFKSVRIAEKMTNTDRNKIIKCARNEISDTGGYKWIYIEKNTKDYYDFFINDGRIKNVLQIDINNGEIINKFKSVRDASNFIGIDDGGISCCLNGKQKSAGGYFWKYNNDINLNIQYKEKLSSKPLVKICIETNQIVDNYNSIIEAVNYNNTLSYRLSRCLKNGKNIYDGYRWEYKNNN